MAQHDKREKATAPRRPPVRRLVRQPPVRRPAPPTVRPRRRRAAGKWLTVLAVLAALAAGGYFGWAYYRDYQAEQAALELKAQERELRRARRGALAAQFGAAMEQGSFSEARATLETLQREGFDVAGEARRLKNMEQANRALLIKQFEGAEQVGDIERMKEVHREMAAFRPDEPMLADWDARLAEFQSRAERARQIETLWSEFRRLRETRRLHRAERALARLENLGAPVATERAMLVRNESLPGGARMRFRWIPPGGFVMGSPRDESDRGDDETPHEVTLTRGFWLGETEVTQAQWASVMNGEPSAFEGVNRPVERITWRQAQDFIEALNSHAGRDLFRLPTEAEWEYACRADTKGPFYTGASLNAAEANYDGNYPYNGGAKGVYLRETAAVASYQPNPWGLYDMHGNVWEWTRDRYAPYSGEPETNPTGPDLLRYFKRVIRGGGWGDFAARCRCAARFKQEETKATNSVGFRVVRVE